MKCLSCTSNNSHKFSISKFEVWKTKIPYNWTRLDTSCWILDYFRQNNINLKYLSKFQNFILPGKHICQMGFEFFTHNNSKHGIHLYEDLQQIISIYLIENENLMSLETRLNFISKQNHFKFNKQMKIWEFFLALLNHNFIDLVKWVNYGDGVFEIINKDDVAKMWGLTKKNYNMDYKKMSKTIRTNYKKKIFKPHSSRLFYQFGQEIILKLVK